MDDLTRERYGVPVREAARRAAPLTTDDLLLAIESERDARETERRRAAVANRRAAVLAAQRAEKDRWLGRAG